jgi:hypothetical protein
MSLLKIALPTTLASYCSAFSGIPKQDGQGGIQTDGSRFSRRLSEKLSKFSDSVSVAFGRLTGPSRRSRKLSGTSASLTGSDENPLEASMKAAFLEVVKTAYQSLDPGTIPSKGFWLDDGSPGKAKCDAMVESLYAAALLTSRADGESSFFTASPSLQLLTFYTALEYIQECERASDDPEDQAMLKNIGDALRERLDAVWLPT